MRREAISYNLWYATHGQKADGHYWTEERILPHHNCIKCRGEGRHLIRILGVRIYGECKCTVVAPLTRKDFLAYIQRTWDWSKA